MLLHGLGENDEGTRRGRESITNQMNFPGVSVLILTKDEEQDLPYCLESVSWSDDVHVMDSGSIDQTCDIARRFGAHVIVKPYPGNSKPFGGDESAHRNWSLHNIAFKYPWVLALDADERATPGLAVSITKAIASPSPYVAFTIQRRDFFMDRWLKHVQTSPFYMRLFQPAKMRYERLVNPVPIANGPVGTIDGFLDHYPFSKGIGHWLDRHNAYSTLEAAQIVHNRRTGAKFSIAGAFVTKDFHERRFHQKELFYRLPCRPLAKFLILYALKCGFMDGRAGFTYAILQSFYEYMIVLKVRECARDAQ